MQERKLKGKSIVVLGASRGVGREIVRRVSAEGAAVLAITEALSDRERLATEVKGIQILALDASRDKAPAHVFDVLRPDVLVICGDANPPLKPVHELTWTEFSEPFDVVRISVLFCAYALRAPLAAGSSVVLVSSGAGPAGWPPSGGYAGATSTQMFMAEHCQRESTRLGLSIRFNCLVPMRLTSETALGAVGIEDYARRLGTQPQEFLAYMSSRQSTHDVAEALVELVSAPPAATETVFAVSAATAIARSSGPWSPSRRTPRLTASRSPCSGSRRQEAQNEGPSSPTVGRSSVAPCVARDTGPRSRTIHHAIF